MDYDRTFGLLRHVDPISREKIKNAIELRLENLFDDIEEIRVDARELQHEVRHILQGACA